MIFNNTGLKANDVIIHTVYISHKQTRSHECTQLHYRRGGGGGADT